MLMEEEFIRNQEVFKPSEESDKAEREKMEDIRGSPLVVGTLEEMIDDNHAIVSTTHGPEYYVTVKRRAKTRQKRDETIETGGGTCCGWVLLQHTRAVCWAHFCRAAHSRLSRS
jgi:ATP-dependent 26S proteasome regulatory subunit